MTSDVLSHTDDPTDDQLRAIADEIITAIERPKRGDSDALGMGPGGWLPKLDLPSFGEAYDECGEDRPHFCVCCGDTVHVGRTCARSMCPRCWVAWVQKRAGTSRENGEDVPGIVAQLDKTARMMSSKLDTAVFKHHIVLSPPMDDWFLEAEDPLARTKEVIKEIMDALNLEGVIFYHPWAGDNEDHDGDDRDAWKKRLGAGRDWYDVRKELKPRGHFHVVGCSPFVPGAGVTERVQAETGWVIKRVEKHDGSGRSLSDLVDVARAVTYNLSHTGVDTSGERNEAAYWKHGSTYHSGEVPEDVADEADAAVRSVAPTTLGISANRITCHQEVPEGNAANSVATRFLGLGEQGDEGGGGGGGAEDPDPPGDPFESQLASPSSGDGVETVECAGRLEHIREAEHYLEDDDWREHAPYAETLQTTWEDWREEDDPPPD